MSTHFANFNQMFLQCISFQTNPPTVRIYGTRNHHNDLAALVSVSGFLFHHKCYQCKYAISYSSELR